MYNYIEFRKLIKAVDRRSEDTFDMTRWRCGTQACAVGSYIEENSNSLLQFDKYNIPVIRNVPYAPQSITQQYIAPFFGISVIDAQHLFLTDSYPYSHTDKIPKQDVLKRLKIFHTTKIISLCRELGPVKKVIVQSLELV